jgi:hypothetical protein
MGSASPGLVDGREMTGAPSAAHDLRLGTAFPDLATLAPLLRELFADRGLGEVVAVIDRRANEFESSWPIEIVRLALADGREIEAICKYQRERGCDAFGHRGGVAREAYVYEAVLQDLPIARPDLYGALRDDCGTLLVLEYLPSPVRLKYCRSTKVFGRAGTWIGDFHRLCEPLVADLPVGALRRYDERFLAGWIDRTLEFARPVLHTHPWLTDVCREARPLIMGLLDGPQTVIHGEYYPDNILYSRGAIYPVDWESAAIGPAEIDLASLFERWPLRFGDAARRAYAASRWPAGAPRELPERLEAAALYLHFRWLGDTPEWTIDEDSRWRFRRLKSAGRRLGWI